MSRSRWVVLLGPPLILIMATGLVDAVGGHRSRVDAGALPSVRAVTACAGPGAASDVGRRPIGTWWRMSPTIDLGGSLTGWTLAAGAGDRLVRLDLPPASSASGPDGGRVIVAADDGARSSIRIIDVAAACQTTVDIDQAMARGAIAEASGNAVLVHLLDRETRADLGVWRTARDGRRTLVLGPVDAATLRAAGIEKVWATTMVATRDGRRLAVQSCDPESCVTRILERGSGRVTVIAGRQGDVLGFSGNRLVTMAACPGLPCGVLSWTDGGSPDVLVDASLGAAIASNGLAGIAVPAAGGAATAVAIDLATRHRHELGPLARETVPLPASARSAGLETGPDAVPILAPSGPPTTLEVLP